MAHDISTPGHPFYGEHMSQHTINNILQPAEEASKLVTDWVSSTGLKPIASPDSSFLYVNTTVSEAQILLNAEHAFLATNCHGRSFFGS